MRGNRKITNLWRCSQLSVVSFSLPRQGDWHLGHTGNTPRHVPLCAAAILIFNHFQARIISSTPSRSKVQKSEIVESIREIAYKEEKQLFTIIATEVFPRNSYFVYFSAHSISVSVADSLMDLNWNYVQHCQGETNAETLAVLLLTACWGGAYGG